MNTPVSLHDQLDAMYKKLSYATDHFANLNYLKECVKYKLLLIESFNNTSKNILLKKFTTNISKKFLIKIDKISNKIMEEKSNVDFLQAKTKCLCEYGYGFLFSRNYFFVLNSVGIKKYLKVLIHFFMDELSIIKVYFKVKKLQKTLK